MGGKGCGSEGGRRDGHSAGQIHTEPVVCLARDHGDSILCLTKSDLNSWVILTFVYKAADRSVFVSTH